MKILVPLKRVVDPYAKVRPSADGLSIDSGPAKFEINPFDEIAMEEAVRQKEKLGGIEITAISVGGPECEEQLRKALAMGADKAILVESPGVWDSPSIAAELAAQVKAEGADLVLMGKQATDDDNNQVGQMLAALLDWPQATFASKLVLNGSTAQVTRETDTGEETLEFDLPGVVTADLRLNQPRYIALPGIIKARSKPLEKKGAVTAPSPKTRVVKIAASPSRPPGRKVESAAELVAALKDRGVL